MRLQRYEIRLRTSVPLFIICHDAAAPFMLMKCEIVVAVF